MNKTPKDLYTGEGSLKNKHMPVNSEYKEIVDLAADNNLNVTIPNSSVEHAKYVLTKIIKKTKNRLTIYSKNLDNEVFGDKEVLNALKENHSFKLRILLEDIDNKVKEYESVSNDIKIRKTHNHVESYYFVVSDNKRVRVCTREKPREAEVNFNSPKGAVLSRHFDQLWRTSLEIS